MHDNVLTASIKKCSFRQERNAIVMDIKQAGKSDISLLHRRELPLYLRRKRKGAEYLNGRYALKHLLSGELGVEYADMCILNERYGEQAGKPRLYINDAPSGYSVSISHDAGIIFAGFADHEIGVDVAVLRKRGSDFCDSPYFADIATGGKGGACLVWAIGEAFTKALGIGLKYGIHSVKTHFMDLEKGIIKLEVSDRVLFYVGRYSDISFTYEAGEQTVFVMCHLIR